MRTTLNHHPKVHNGFVTVILSLILIMVSPGVLFAEGPTSAEYGVVLKLFGKQRMLSQKMSKEFLLVAYGHERGDNKLSLLETYSLFQHTLKGLLDGDETHGLPADKPQHIRDQLGVVNGLWTKLKPIVEYGADYKTNDIPKEKLSLLAQTNLPLLKEMNNAVGMYEKETAK